MSAVSATQFHAEDGITPLILDLSSGSASTCIERQRLSTINSCDRWSILSCNFLQVRQELTRGFSRCSVGPRAMDFVSCTTNAGVMVDMASNRSDDKCEYVLGDSKLDSRTCRYRSSRRCYKITLWIDLSELIVCLFRCLYLRYPALYRTHPTPHTHQIESRIV